MIISHFNRYVEKHGRKTYIVLGVIISLMFVVFVTPGDMFGGAPGARRSLGKMYGKTLKTQVMMKRMNQADLASLVRYGRYLSQNGGQEQLFEEALRRMRAIHEAKKRGMDKVSKEEIATAIHEMPFFRDEKGFSLEAFQNFKTNFLQRSGLTAGDFDEMVKENIIIDRLEKEVIDGIAIEDREVNEWVENYTVSFAEIKADEATAGNPSDEEIKAFFAKRRGELKVEPRRATLVASVLSTQLLTKAALDEALKAELEPTEDEMRKQYDAMKDRIYKDKSFEDAKAQISVQLKNRKAAEKAKAIIDELGEKMATVTGSDAAARSAQFKALATAAGGEVAECDFFSTGTTIPGLPGAHPNLANAIRGLNEVGQVTKPLWDSGAHRLALLTAIEPGTMPEELNDELRDNIIDIVVTEKATAFYNEKIAPYTDKATKVASATDLAEPYEQELQKNSTLSDEERAALASAHRDMLNEIVRPFFKAEQRSFTAAAFLPESFVSEVVLTDSDLEAGYEKRKDVYQKVEVRFAQIVVKTTADMDEAAKAAKRARIDEAAKKLADGTTFDDLVAEYSEDENSKAKKGETDLMDTSMLNKDLAAKISAMDVGQISGVIATDNAFYLVKLLEKRPARSLAEVREELRTELIAEASKKMAFDAAIELSEALVDTWGRAQDKEAKVAAETMFTEMTTGNDKLSVVTANRVMNGGYVPQELLNGERALMADVFTVSMDEPFTNAINGNKGAFVACLREVVAPKLESPLENPALMNNLKSVYRRQVAMDAAKTRATAAADVINTALKNDPDLAKAAGDLAFKPVETPFSRMKMRDMKDFTVRDSMGLLTALSKAELKTVLPPQKTFGGYVLVYLQDRVVPEDEESKGFMENIRGYVLRNKQNTALGEFYERLERESNTQLAEGLQRVE
ncbi:peptidylprolyl isomerase [Oligosphaera ethanolica]|uniref:Periplasmic chaperone PpiD n=1 Tax=Oligosphaera ethanolica TaxID=760260 RepID=A0AAE3VFW9_9BACT|nr:peptidyl-prolyl cis-trans isomerase [Oligosphaera ethanolica]MDQ0289742.1 parvulin-like peptidyl-prolyl isomerase [Oligosphaera ethanolica]